jgi:hypothetical protein
MVRIRQGHDATAMLLSARNAHLHGLLANHLTVTPLTVQREHVTQIQQCFDRGIGFQTAFQHGGDITRHHADAMRIVAAQIGHDQVA